jgi:flagellar assembly protein FliH
MSKESSVLAATAEVMNMLAKVVKKDFASGILPYSIPEIGKSQNDFENVQQIDSPDFEPFDETENLSETFDEPNIENVLQKAREEAARIIAQAEQDKQMIEQAAEEKGLQNIEEKVREEVAKEVDEIREKLTETISEISSLQGEITSRVEIELVEFALNIAKKVVRREVTIDREIALTLVKVSLEKLHNRTLAQIHLHPNDFAYVESKREHLDFHNALELIEDKTISPGGCLIHTETGDIDARIESQFEEIAHGLLDN